MNLNQVTLKVKNLKESCKFYRKMGFTQIVDAEHYARFECPDGDATFSLDYSESPFENPTVIYFENENLDQLVNDLKSKGFKFDQDPTDMNWLWREAIIHDPSGNKIKLFQAGDNRLYPPWRVELKN